VGANLAGAICGAVLVGFLGRPLAAMAIGIMLVGLGCYALKLEDMLRPAFVAVILVTLAGESGEFQASRNRVVGVMAGCLCAVAVGFLMDKLWAQLKLEGKETGEGKADE